MNDIMVNQSGKKLIFSSDKEKNWLKALLREFTVEILFTKKDGTDRKMVCTLQESAIPSENLPKGTSTVKNNESLAVYDMENSGWRSFRWDSIKEVKFTIGEDQNA
jgi:CRISPR/Cas system CSM-associated protein Csm5 (group 7 of RAMP superfamily)